MQFRFPLLSLLLIGVWSVSGVKAGERDMQFLKQAEVSQPLDEAAKDSILNKRTIKNTKAMAEEEEEEEEGEEEEEKRNANPKLRMNKNEADSEAEPMETKHLAAETENEKRNERNMNQRYFWFGEEPAPGLHTSLFHHHHKRSCDDEKCSRKRGTWQPLADCSGERDKPMLYCDQKDEFCCGERNYRPRTKRCKQNSGSCVTHYSLCDGEFERKRCRAGRRYCCYWKKPTVNQTCAGSTYILSEDLTLTDSAARIVSPGNMVRYRRYLDISTNIVLPVGMVARIEWKEIDIEENARCLYDYVQITDTVTGEGLEPYNIDKFCGKKLPHTMDSKSNLVTIKFKTDYSVQEKGFIICYTAVPAP
ncbi:uncharacterized protein LOC122267950 [Penaeus japonicus]|uniref:uncharacterized protein LOC122267950 n=1 Tax=Penaeus japonicus TaxID=27405 RepID=UPI001C70F06D|nr:uncharacterized protein LOC122267950 [Penaeus japonicus]